jgi:transcriptional regulator with XRE-family HTH domain
MSTIKVDIFDNTTDNDNHGGQMIPNELGTTLRQLRQSKALSQQALADRAEVSRNFVAQIERGESAPTVVTLRRIATALGITTAELLGEDAGVSDGSKVEIVRVPLVSDRIAAGSPLVVSDAIEEREGLPCGLLRSLGVETHNAVLVRLGRDQDSMADTIPPGSTVLVDRQPIREVVAKGIYAVREESLGETGCSVKRLVLDASARVLILLSDNPAHLPRAIRFRTGQSLSDLIVGRVVWWMPPPPVRR